MLVTVGDQPSLFESVLPPELLRLPQELGRVDALLDDPVFFEPFVPFFDPRLGRPSTSMETYLRLMFLKSRYRLGYESLCREVSDSITWRRFCRIPARIRFAARPPAPASEVEVSKTLLRPVASAAGGVASYSAGVDIQAAAVVKGEGRLAAERARAGGPRPGEIPRLEGLQSTRLEVLNRKLIQETMFNRFDASIKKWTDHYNSTFGYTGGRALDPNLVKSMLFQESQLGTAGEHMMPTPASPSSRKSRFNLGQVIDSSGPALHIMMSEIEPALIGKHNLANLGRDFAAAERRIRELKAKSSRNPAEEAELADLLANSGEAFYWSYKASGSATGFHDAVTELLNPAGGAASRQLDYDFWVQPAVRWLYEKRKSVTSWEQAVQAYNGSGPGARSYRKEVVDRSAAAVSAKSRGERLTPAKI